MRITVLSTGSLGDVQPFLALAIRLMSANHEVCLAVPPTYKNLIESYGVRFSTLGQNYRDLLQQAKLRSRIASVGNLAFFTYQIREKQRQFDQINIQAFQACRDADLIIYRISNYLAVSSIAQNMNLPSVEMGITPLVRTRAFPSMYFYGVPNLGATYNLATHIFAEQMLWLLFRNSTNKFRKKILGMAPLPVTSPERLKREYGVPVLHAFSPYVVAKPADWPAWAHVTGYWFLNGIQGWQPPEALVKFIEYGSPPVYIGFGSMPSRDPQATLDLLIKALEMSGQRAVLATGSSGIRPLSSPSNQCFFVESVPHEWLFPRMSAVVHHGGMGTTAASIRAGVPTIIVPHNYDQPYWGQTVAKLGIGPKPIPRKKLSAENLSGAINLALSNPDMRKKAETVGKRVREEDGVGCAVDLIHQYAYAFPKRLAYMQVKLKAEGYSGKGA